MRRDRQHTMHDAQGIQNRINIEAGASGPALVRRVWWGFAWVRVWAFCRAARVVGGSAWLTRFDSPACSISLMPGGCESSSPRSWQWNGRLPLGPVESQIIRACLARIPPTSNHTKDVTPDTASVHRSPSMLTSSRTGLLPSVSMPDSSASLGKSSCTSKFSQ